MEPEQLGLLRIEFGDQLLPSLDQPGKRHIGVRDIQASRSCNTFDTVQSLFGESFRAFGYHPAPDAVSRQRLEDCCLGRMRKELEAASPPWMRGPCWTGQFHQMPFKDM